SAVATVSLSSIIAGRTTNHHTAAAPIASTIGVMNSHGLVRRTRGRSARESSSPTPSSVKLWLCACAGGPGIAGAPNGPADCGGTNGCCCGANGACCCGTNGACCCGTNGCAAPGPGNMPAGTAPSPAPGGGANACCCGCWNCGCGGGCGCWNGCCC